jgi:outer membrane protein
MHQISRVLRPAIIALILAASVTGAQTSAQKFAYVNSQLILDRAPGSAQLQAQIEKERQANQGKVQKMQDSLQLMIAALNKDGPTLPDSQKAKRTKAIQEKQSEWEQRANEIDQQAQQRENELVQPMMQQIREVLDKIRQEEGYAFIFDVGQSNTIVAADKNLDITDRVLARLKPVAVNAIPTKPDSTGKPAAGTKTAPAGIIPVKKPPTS